MKLNPIRIEDSSLEVLRQEDQVLRDLFERLAQLLDLPPQITNDHDREAAVLSRNEYATAVRAVLLHLAVRQSATMDVARTLSGWPELSPTAAEIAARGTACRPMIRDPRRTLRTTNPMPLGLHMEFEQALRSLLELSSKTIEWELTEAIPAIAGPFDAEGLVLPFSNAQFVRAHAPRRLSLSGP